MNRKRTMVFTLRGLINSGLVNPKHVCVRVDFGDAWLQELSTHKNYSDYLDYEVLGIESTGNTNQICVRLKGKNYNEEAATNRTKTMTIFDLKVAIKDLPDNMKVLIPLYENFEEEFPNDHRIANTAGVISDDIYGNVFSFGIDSELIPSISRINNYTHYLFPNVYFKTNPYMTISDLENAIKDLPDNMEVFIPLYDTGLNSNKFILKDIGEVKFAGVVNDKTYGKGFSLIIAPDITTLDFENFYRPNPNVDFANQFYPIIG